MQNSKIKIFEPMDIEACSSNKGWQEKVFSLHQVLISVLDYKSQLEGADISQHIIESYLPLNKLAELYVQAVDKKWPAEICSLLENYFNALAGFDMSKVAIPSEWDQEAIRQHTYLTKQLISHAEPV